ncbi:MAG TPA: DHHA1 domain-containing protein [Candidatus Limnocylindrales bacterium]|jgi:phosphoesterase RecJ-like protein
MSAELGLDPAAVPGPVVEALRRARHVVALTHENPDADTLGATLALCWLVEALGGRATPISSDPVPPLYAFIPGADTVRHDLDPDAEYDLLVVSDGPLDRTGSVLERNRSRLAALPRVVIDHHASNVDVGPSDWIDPASAATCEMVTLLALRLGCPLDLRSGAMATALTAGLVMDTAAFNHPNTTPRTLRVAAALVEAGAPLAEITRRIYRSKPERQLRLFGRVLERVRSDLDGRLVWSTLDEADHRATGTDPAESEGIIDLLAQAEDAEVAMLFKEAGAETRISVRTRPGGVDATVLTGRFGGGGHARAAGATVALPLRDAQDPVLAEARRVIANVRR